MDLGQQIGPLPLGAWIGVVAGGLGIAYYTRKGGAGSPAAGDTSSIDTSGQPGVGDGSVGGWQANFPANSTTTNPAAAAADAAPTTNDEWAIKAINGLIARNYDPILVDSGIRKYVSGANDLSVGEYTIVRMALLFYGSPPQVLPATDQTPANNTPIGNTTPTPVQNNPTPAPPTSVPKPVTPAPKPPAPQPVTAVKKYRYYTVVRGDSLWNIAKKFYGNGAKYGTIFNANRKGAKRADGKVGMISSANLIQPGWVLLIP